MKYWVGCALAFVSVLGNAFNFVYIKKFGNTS